MSEAFHAPADEHGAVVDACVDHAIAARGPALVQRQAAPEQRAQGTGRDAGGAVFEARIEVIEVAAFELAVGALAVGVQAVHANALAPVDDGREIGCQGVQRGGVTHLDQQFRAADRGHARRRDRVRVRHGEQARDQVGRQRGLDCRLRRQAHEVRVVHAREFQLLGVHRSGHDERRGAAREQRCRHRQRGMQAQGTARVRIIEVDDRIGVIEPHAGGVAFTGEGLARVRGRGGVGVDDEGRIAVARRGAKADQGVDGHAGSQRDRLEFALHYRCADCAETNHVPGLSRSAGDPCVGWPGVNDFDATLTSYGLAETFAMAPVLGITILWHPERERIGEQVLGPAAGGAIALNRFSPLFARAGSVHEGIPLGERSITREPVHIGFGRDSGLTIEHLRGKMPLEINGTPSSGADVFTAADLERGIVLGLGSQVFVCLHLMRSLPRAATVPGLIGVGSAALKMREAIGQVAGTTLPVLLLGETGCGKEVAARAIHALSARRGQRLVAVNMATLSESLAGAELFGVVKGAYTGATSSRSGWFAEAEGGTLFLDEIGNTPASVQPMLLRVLENGEYRPLGAPADAVSTARIVAATDQDLGAAGFNQALRRRMEAFVIHVPSLRERREDVGALVRHFLEAEMGDDDWTLPRDVLSQVFNGQWPGNIRQLAHAMRRVALDLKAGLVPVIEQSAAAPVTVPAQRPARRKVAALSEDDLLEAMEQNQWQILAAAKFLGVSRPTVYKLLEAHPRIRFPAHIAEDEIRAAWQASGGDLQRCASRLKTPAEALRRHLGVLEIGL